MAQNTGTRSVERTWASIVKDKEPDFEAQKRRETEYDFRDAGRAGQGRLFATDRAKRFPYDQS